ncbi:MAG TPA: TlpA disulfide reductase family protein [Burkholderiales bacterium]|nr:TlpA disulfide reductase family protein [Burkholderiales bacterium]
MSRGRARAVLAAVALLAAAAGYAVHSWMRGEAAPDTAAAQAVFAARFPGLEGGEVSLERWRGHVLVVNFWATWCTPCREEIPLFVRMQERYGRRGLQFVGIAIDQPEKVAEFAREFRVNYPLLVAGADALALARAAGNRPGVLPFTLVIDRSGAIAGRQLGEFKEARLEELIKPLL